MHVNGGSDNITLYKKVTFNHLCTFPPKQKPGLRHKQGDPPKPTHPSPLNTRSARGLNHTSTSREHDRRRFSLAAGRATGLGRLSGGHLQILTSVGPDRVRGHQEMTANDTVADDGAGQPPSQDQDRLTRLDQRTSEDSAEGSPSSPPTPAAPHKRYVSLTQALFSESVQQETPFIKCNLSS